MSDYILPIPDFLKERLQISFVHLDKCELKLRTNELLKFLFLCSKYSGGFAPIKKEVDEVWHEFILQTVEYAELCDSLPGRHFIHHRSGNLSAYMEKIDAKKVITRLMQWIPMYYKHFGPMNNEEAKLWTIPSYLIKELGMTLQNIEHMAERFLETQEHDEKASLL